MPHQLLEHWISNHSLLESILPRHLPRIQCANQTFIFQYIGIDEGAKKMIFGYHIDPITNILKIRSWCKSDSEGYWRCFLGICVDQDSSSARLMKGAEYLGTPEMQQQTDMGYIYETMTVNVLNNALEMFWINEMQKLDRHSQLTKMHLYDFICQKYPNLLIHDEELIQYNFFTNAAINLHSMLAIEYAQEHLNYIVPFPAEIASQIIELLKKVTNINFQLEYESMSFQPDQREQRIGLGHRIKHDAKLWQWILNCLNDPIDVHLWHHSLLNKTCTTHRYKLYYPLHQAEAEKFQYPKKDEVNPSQPYLIIEITHTNEAQRFDYATNISIETVYCWVNNIYFSNAPITSFGNKNNTPINFSFLVQKPIDYAKYSVSQYYLEKQLNIIDFASPNIIDDAYVQTALLNEALNPLIKKFKIIKHFNLFRNKYRPQATTEYQHYTASSSALPPNPVSLNPELPPSPSSSRLTFSRYSKPPALCLKDFVDDTSSSPLSQSFKTPRGSSPLSQSFKTPRGSSPFTP